MAAGVRFRTCGLVLVVAVAWVGCETPGAYTLREHRGMINKRCQETLQELYLKQPEAREVIEAAAGYAVFRQGGLKVELPGKGEGYGFAVDNQNGKRTFMRTRRIAPDFQVVFVFEDKEILQRFVSGGWQFGDGSPPNLRVYQLTATPLAGTRYWTDKILN